MRRTDREVTNPAEITEMMTRCEVLHLALNTDTVPYILPVNFGMEPDGMTLYIHGAREGTKYALIEKDNRAGFELDCTHGLVLENGMCSINYESVIVRAIWGDTDASSTKKLQVNMANIRRKIEENPGQPKYIFTEVGVGYRMREGD